MTPQDETGVAPWHAFWLASELSAATGAAFGQRIDDFSPVAAEPPNRFVYGAADRPLVRPTDDLARLLATRRTGRDFGEGRLPAATVGSLFSAFADTGGRAADGARRRAWPSAGGLYPVEVFACLLAVDHPFDRRAVHYEPDTHGLTDIGPAPGWPELAPALSAGGVTGTPHVVVLFVLDTATIETKYGNRAGRFALVEVGHAAQNLALRLAADELTGCELGGTHDRSLLATLGLAGSGARLALAYACGRPPPPPPRRRRRR